MSQSLAVKWRPRDWSEICGQSIIIQTLQKQIETNSLHHCYLFCGASGDGKTTIARLFATKLNNNQGSPIEIDAASNNSVENVRMIIKSAQERALDAKYKVYIIDEAHALSSNAWQAFLKCIEEPPEYTIFIFCTTDPQKIPLTILNRVQRFNFTRISLDDIRKRLTFICEQEGFSNYTDTVEYVAKLANGGMRDAIAALELCSSLSKTLSIENTLKCLGNYSYDLMFKLINAMIDGDEKTVLFIVDDLYEKGNDLKVFIDQYLTFCIDITKYILFKSFDSIRIPSIYKSELDRTINIENNQKYFIYVVDKLLEIKTNIKYDLDIQSTINVFFLKLTRCV